MKEKPAIPDILPMWLMTRKERQKLARKFSEPNKTMKEKPTVSDVLPEMYAYRDAPGNGLGGSLHIVLDDENVEDSHVQQCIENARVLGDLPGVKLGETILLMSRTQRLKLARKFYEPNETKEK